MLARLTPCEPVADGVTKRKVVFKIKPKAQAAAVMAPAAATPFQVACSLGEEIDENIRDWYAALGQPVPPEELGIGVRMEAEERGEVAATMAAPPPADTGAAGPKPEFGTPEFWAWARKRKKEKEAEKVVKDAEKAAAAKAKAEAAAAALAEKAAKAAEKAQVEAAKAKKN